MHNLKIYIYMRESLKHQANSPDFSYQTQTPQQGSYKHTTNTPSTLTINMTEQYPSDIVMSKPYMSDNAIQQIQAHSAYPTYSQYMAQANNVFNTMLKICRNLQLPIRTFGTAMVLFSRYCLLNSRIEGAIEDTVIGCLLCACKIEDTPKKSRDLFNGLYSVVKLPPQQFEPFKARAMVLELQILETLTFDFRIRHPQPYIIKIAKDLKAPKEVAALAWTISIDAYRTHIHMKRPPHTIALACLILAGKLLKETSIFPIKSENYNSDRPTVNLALLDLLDMYIIYLDSTKLAPKGFPKSEFSQLRNAVSKEAEHYHKPEEFPLSPEKEREISKAFIRDDTRSKQGTVRYILEWEVHQLSRNEEVI